MMTALLAGATGLVGNELLQQLCNNSSYDKIIVLSRNELKMEHPKIECRLINFDQLGSLNFNEKIDCCFCCLGTTQKKMGREGLIKVDYEYVLELGKLCERHNVSKYLVVSSSMANAQSMAFYMRTKGQMEIAVSKLSIPAVWFVRPSLLVGNRSEKRPAESMGYYLYKALEPVMVGKLRKMRAISGMQVAHAMIRLADGKSDVTGRFFIESDQLASF